MQKPIRHACRFLTGNNQIAAYLDMIERNSKLLRDIRRSLPAPLDEHCLYASLEAETLTLVTDSPVWSSRLRFFAPELQRRLGSHSSPIASCRIRVQPRAISTYPTAGKETVYKLSQRAADHLIEAAEGIEDAELAAALRRLARVGTRSD